MYIHTCGLIAWGELGLGEMQTLWHMGNWGFRVKTRGAWMFEVMGIFFPQTSYHGYMHTYIHVSE